MPAVVFFDFFNGADGSRAIQYFRSIDSVNANAREGLLQCERERTSDESGAINGNGSWKAEI
jgi:hypothetical protein